MSETEISVSGHKVSETTFITSVYAWMTLALLVTGLTAMYSATSEEIIRFVFGTPFVFYALIIGEFALVWFLSARIASMSNSMALGLFILYSVLSGVTLSMIFLVYTASSIALTFFITAGTFGVMSAAGYFTKKDLSGFGSLMMMGLLGIIIASIANWFMNSETLSYIISYVGVMVFVGLIAYDTQKLKNMASQLEPHQAQRASIMGALALYLDLVNLFLFLLRIFGGRK